MSGKAADIIRKLMTHLGSLTCQATSSMVRDCTAILFRSPFPLKHPNHMKTRGGGLNMRHRICQGFAADPVELHRNTFLLSMNSGPITTCRRHAHGHKIERLPLRHWSRLALTVMSCSVGSSVDRLNKLIGPCRVQVELQRRLGLEQKRQREILIQKSKEITSLKKSAAK